MTKGKVVFELANVGSKSEGVHPFLVMEDGKKVKLGLLGDNPFMHTRLKEYDQKNVILEGDFNDNGKFIATNIQEDKPVEENELKAVATVETEQYHIKSVDVGVEPCCCEPEASENTPCEEASMEEGCCDEPCCCDEQCCCEESVCDCEKENVEG